MKKTWKEQISPDKETCSDCKTVIPKGQPYFAYVSIKDMDVVKKHRKTCHGCVLKAEEKKID